MLYKGGITMGWLNDKLCKWAIKRQIKKISSSNCNEDTLSQSYSVLMNYANKYSDNEEILSEVYEALDICFKSPKNNNDTYDQALYLVSTCLQDNPKFTPYVADVYKRVSNDYGDTNLVSYLCNFYDKYPEQASTVAKCIKNVSENNVGSEAFSSASIGLLSHISDSSDISNKLKALDAMYVVVAKEEKENKGIVSSDNNALQMKGDSVSAVISNALKADDSCISEAICSINGMDLSSPEVARKALDIVEIGLGNKNEMTFNLTIQVLNKIIDKHPDLAKDVFDVVKSRYDENRYNYASNGMSSVLMSVGMADSSLAKEVSEMEKELHPRCPNFQFEEVGDEMLCKSFVYNKDNSLLSTSYWKDGELHGPSMLYYDNKLKMVENYKKGKKDGLEVCYSEDNKVSGIAVYSNDKITNWGIDSIITSQPINELNNGSFLQMHEGGFGCIYSDGTLINVDVKNKAIIMFEKNGVSHKFSGQAAYNMIEKISSCSSNEERVDILHVSCQKMLDKQSIVKDYER